MPTAASLRDPVLDPILDVCGAGGLPGDAHACPLAMVIVHQSDGWADRGFRLAFLRRPFDIPALAISVAVTLVFFLKVERRFFLKVERRFADIV